MMSMCRSNYEQLLPLVVLSVREKKQHKHVQMIIHPDT
jgi:hypothetical protein